MLTNDTRIMHELTSIMDCEVKILLSDSFHTKWDSLKSIGLEFVCNWFEVQAYQRSGDIISLT